MAEQSPESGKVEQSAESGKAEQSADNPIAKYLGPPIMAMLGGGLTWLTAGSTEIKPALTVLAAVLGGIFGLVISLLYGRYFGILGSGSAPARSPERSAYVRLRRSLAEGGKPAVVYAQWLTRFLDAVDGLFGDADMADRTLFPHIFGLKKKAPLWTAPAFDRCLAIALLYPMATIVLVWAISGDVGAAHTALLGLDIDVLESIRREHQPMEIDAPGWQRGVVVIAFGIVSFLLYCWFRLLRTPGSLDDRIPQDISEIVAMAGHLTFYGLLWAFLFGAFFAPGIMGFTVALAGAAAVIDVGGFMATAVVFVAACVNSLLFAVAFLLGFPIALALKESLKGEDKKDGVVARMRRHSQLLSEQGTFLSLFFAAVLLLCFAAAGGASRWPNWWEVSGPLILFLSLLPLLNAPFDWASLGLTRALLRRGLELGGWSPFVLALVDALLAAVVIALLALTMVGVLRFSASGSREPDPTNPLRAELGHGSGARPRPGCTPRCRASSGALV